MLCAPSLARLGSLTVGSTGQPFLPCADSFPVTGAWDHLVSLPPTECVRLLRAPLAPRIPCRAVSFGAVTAIPTCLASTKPPAMILLPPRSVTSELEPSANTRPRGERQQRVPPTPPSASASVRSSTGGGLGGFTMLLGGRSWPEKEVTTIGAARISHRRHPSRRSAARVVDRLYGRRSTSKNPTIQFAFV